MTPRPQSPRVYHLPEREFSPIDALNRRAAALGSPGYAMSTAHADYNGHRVTLAWNEYRGYYVAEYFWAGRVVIARGSFADCLSETLREWRRGALGSSAVVAPRPDDAEAHALCAETPELTSTDGRPWFTWKHQVAGQSARDYANPGMLVRVFDWPLLEAAATEAEYDNAVKAKYGRVWA